MSTLKHPRAEGLLNNPSFSQVVVASGKRTIYTAGQVAFDESGALAGQRISVSVPRVGALGTAVRRDAAPLPEGTGNIANTAARLQSEGTQDPR